MTFVAVDDEAVIGGIDYPTDSGAVVGTPCPDVIDNDVVAVDFEAGGWRFPQWLRRCGRRRR